MTISLVELKDEIQTGSITKLQYIVVMDYWLEEGKVYNNVDIIDYQWDEDGQIIVKIKSTEPFGSPVITPSKLATLKIETDGIYSEHIGWE